MVDIFERNRLLLGEDNFAKLQSKKVLVLGLGGVGGTCLIALVRSGVGALGIVDFDVVSASNINRQILFTSKDIGRGKVEVALEYISSLDIDTHVYPIMRKIDESFFLDHDVSDYDFVIDAIDDLDAKVMVASYCLEHHVPFLSSLGMANRLDASKVSITRLDKTHDDPLAKKFRYLLRQKGIDLKQVEVAWSSEIPLVKGVIPASMMMVPSSAGLVLASKCISSLIK